MRPIYPRYCDVRLSKTPLPTEFAFVSYSRNGDMPAQIDTWITSLVLSRLFGDSIPVVKCDATAVQTIVAEECDRLKAIAVVPPALSAVITTGVVEGTTKITAKKGAKLVCSHLLRDDRIAIVSVAPGPATIQIVQFVQRTQAFRQERWECRVDIKIDPTNARIIHVE